MLTSMGRGALRSQRCASVALGLVALACAAAACKPSPGPDEGARRRATAAKDALAKALLSRVRAVVETEGLAAAVNVCAAEAEVIAQRVAADHKVAIGRTSFRLRNPGNVAPAWATSHVDGRTGEPAFVDLGGGKLGALYPIRLAKLCEGCHGDPATFAPDLRNALASFYPNDSATGFSEGDLRGWFWVETR